VTTGCSCSKTDPAASEAIDMPMEVLLGKPPQMQRDVERVDRVETELDLTGVDLATVARTSVRHPTVASKRFLVTIGDRTVGGLSHRDQMVGPVAGPGGRRCGDARGIRGLCRRGDGQRRADAPGRARRPGLRADGRR
jgi:phosphoribosylformylglycinamidine (FGAM) synthase-like enzyme